MIAAVLAAALSAGAPGLPADPHIRYARFEENRVTALTGYLGFQTTIGFEAGERIENAAIGDAAIWQITPNKRADILFVKPIARGPATNLVVVTNRRTYAFALTVAPAKASAAGSTWVLRFVVPSRPPAALTPAPPPPVTPVGKNADYTLAGSAALLPARVFDDGRSTYFSWPEQAALPAIYAVNPDGSEAMVNFVMRDGYAMVQQTAGRFVLRQGAGSATVTSTPGTAVRLAKAER